MSLYRRVRPTSLDEIVGNDSVIAGLKRWLKDPNRNHAILLHGPFGCGKTTIARILARELGADDNSIFELNAANTRGIDTTREIASTADLVALGGKTKVYIVDESHELTNNAQQNFLKITEEAPEHCYFIFCTTDAQNLNKGLRQRCSEFPVTLLSREQIVQVLESACRKGGLNVDSSIIEAISYACEGAPREALVQLEMVAGISDVDEALDIIVKGTKDDSRVIDLCRIMVAGPAIRRKKWKLAVDILSDIEEDNERIRRSILSFLFSYLRRLDKDDVDIAMDVVKVVDIFSTNTYYGGKAQLCGLVLKACFTD